jgi:hypothetical protein
MKVVYSNTVDPESSNVYGLVPEMVASVQACDNIEMNEVLFDYLTNGIAVFSYKKVDGKIRTAIGTLNAKYIPARTDDPDEGERVEKRKRKLNEGIQNYYDIESQDWRSFRKEDLYRLLIKD